MTNQSTNRREQILDVASKLFTNKGFDATTMRDIATEMGMEAASLYHHIKSKDELLEVICFQMADKFMNAITEINDIYFNPEEKLRTAISRHVSILTQNPEQSMVFQNEWKSLRGDKLNQFVKLRNEYEKGIRAIIRQGVDEDVFADVNQKFATLTILSTVNGVNEWYKAGGEMNPTEIAIQLCEFVMGGLRKRLVTDLNYKP